MRKMGEEVYVVAKYDYQAQESQELDIKKNEKLLLLDDSKDWWKVQNSQHQAGFVPSNFVKKCKPSLLTSLKNTLGRRKGSDAKLTLASGHGAVKNGDSSDVHTYSDQACDVLPRIAKYAYQAQQADEISLEKGERIMVLEKSSDGWWKGRKDNNEMGWFPSNYVDTEDPDQRTYANPPETSSGLSTTKCHHPCVETVVTLYPYTSSNSEELSFEKDETLEIVEKPPIDPDWWKARNQKGEIGLVPRNYVQTLSTDSGFQQPTPESQSNSSLSGQSQGASSRTPSGGTSAGVIKTRLNLSGPFADKVWFYGNITRAECEHMLNSYGEDGDFMIRESESNIGHYTVTLKATPRNKHFKVSIENGTFCIGQQTFDSLDDLVEHYKNHPIYRHQREKLYLIRAFISPTEPPDEGI